MFHRLGNKGYSFCWFEIEEFLVVEPVEHVLDDLVFLLHDQDCVFLVEGWFAFSAAGCVVDQRFLQFGSYAHVIDYQTAFLAGIDAVDSCYRLHQRVTLYWLVKVHGVKRWGVKSGQKHVSYD